MLRDQLKGVTAWRRGSERAPHKPLLLLMALAAVQRGEERLIAYKLIDERLRELLLDFGPPRTSYHPEYPFWRLQNDGGFWEISEREEALARVAGRERTGDVPAKVLLEIDAQGGFSESAYDHLRENPQLVSEVAAEILEEHFPESLHDAILDAVGMPWVPAMTHRRWDSGSFRDTLLRIYEYRCAVCGFDGRLGQSDLGLDAAHVKWRAYGGPDEQNNGVLLCNFHHRMLDRGALGLDTRRRILISQHVHGGDQVESLLTRFSGSPLRRPQEGAAPVASEYIRWHLDEVFRGPPRAVN